MTYSRVDTLNFENCIVRVHYPDLTDEERERRKKGLKAAAAKLLIAKEDKENRDGKGYDNCCIGSRAMS